MGSSQQPNPRIRNRLRSEDLHPFQDQIRNWRAAGKTLRDIAQSISQSGLPVDHNQVARYCKRFGLSLDDGTDAEPTNETEQADPNKANKDDSTANNPILPGGSEHADPSAAGDAPTGSAKGQGEAARNLAAGPAVAANPSSTEQTPESPLKNVVPPIDLTAGTDGSFVGYVDASIPYEAHSTPPETVIPSVEGWTSTCSPVLDPAVTLPTDADVGLYDDVLAVMSRLQAAIDLGDLDAQIHEIRRLNLWIIAEGDKAPRYILDLVRKTYADAQARREAYLADQPPPLPEVVIGNPFLTIFQAQRRYEWAASQNNPVLLRGEIERIVTWLERSHATLNVFEREKMDAVIADLRAAASEQHIDKPNSLSPDAERENFGAQKVASPPPHQPSDKTLIGTEPFEPLLPGEWSQDLPMLRVGSGDQWTLQDACEGTLILGSVGSGKTSGSGAAIADSLLHYDFGGLVLTAKGEEATLWKKYAENQGRTEQLCIVRPRGAFRFNFLKYIQGLPAEKGGSTEDIVTFFYTLLESFSSQSDGGGVTNAAFWERTGKQLLRGIVRLIRYGGGNLDLPTIRAIIREAPRTTKEANSGAFSHSPVFGKLLAAARARSSDPREAPVIDEISNYFLNDYPALAPETRSSVVTSFSSMIDLLFEPDLYELLGTDTTITPDAVLEGAVIVLNVPVLIAGSMGRIFQGIWKYFFQHAVERRTDAADLNRRPVFLWVDEAQYFWSRRDGSFVSTSRSLRCANVYLTQNLPNFCAMMPARDARTAADGFFANLNTKIFHANNDPSTNHFAAEQIGKVIKYRSTFSEPARHFPRRLLDWFTPQPSGVSTQQQMDFDVQPSEFTKLKTGSEQYAFFVEAYLVKSGARFSNGKHYLHVTFQQESL